MFALMVLVLFNRKKQRSETTLLYVCSISVKMPDQVSRGNSAENVIVLALFMMPSNEQ